MFIKRLFCLLVLCAATGCSYGQKGDFCEAIGAILKDAPRSFKNVHAPTPENGGGVASYRSSITVPGTVASRFVTLMGLHYQGALKQSKTLEGIKADYEKYKVLLKACLEPKGYAMRTAPNFTVGLEDYKKVMYMPDFKRPGSVAAPIGHVAMEVDYNKDAGLYTLLLFIYEK